MRPALCVTLGTANYEKEISHIKERNKEAVYVRRAVQQTISRHKPIDSTMKALVFCGPNKISVEQVPIPKPGQAILSSG